MVRNSLHAEIRREAAAADRMKPRPLAAAPLRLPLSFSVERMRPWIETGVKAIRQGLPRVSYMSINGRVKRQTLRSRDDGAAIDPYRRAFDAVGMGRDVRLRLWWKQRTDDRKLLGEVDLAAIFRVSLVRSGPRRPLAIVADSVARHARIEFPAIDVFAKLDGFENAAEMEAFFFDGPDTKVRTRKLWLITW